MNWEDIYYRVTHPSFTPTFEPINSKPMRGSVQDVLLDEERSDPVHGKLHPPIKGWDANF